MVPQPLKPQRQQREADEGKEAGAGGHWRPLTTLRVAREFETGRRRFTRKAWYIYGVLRPAFRGGPTSIALPRLNSPPGHVAKPARLAAQKSPSSRLTRPAWLETPCRRRYTAAQFRLWWRQGPGTRPNDKTNG